MRTNWAENEKQYLCDHYGKLKPPEIAAVLGRTSASVRGMARRLGAVEKRTGLRPLFRHRRKRCSGCRKLYMGGKCPRCG